MTLNYRFRAGALGSEAPFTFDQYSEDELRFESAQPLWRYMHSKFVLHSLYYLLGLIFLFAHFIKIAITCMCFSQFPQNFKDSKTISRPNFCTY